MNPTQSAVPRSPRSRVLPELSRASTIDDTLLAWLVLAPVWPEDTAKRLLFAGATTSAQDNTILRNLEQGVQAGLLASNLGAMPWRGRWFMLRPALRNRATEHLLLAKEGGIEFLSQQLQLMGRRLATTTPHAYPPALDCFRVLALAAADSKAPCDVAMAEVLERRVRDALASGRKNKEVSFPEVNRWIEAAKPLADIFGGQLSVESARARVRLTLN
jgi:hypothetical protein